MEWISVKDRLPEKEGKYWVAIEINGRLKSDYCLWQENSRVYQDNKFGWRSREIVKRCNIRFWMEIPKPPIDWVPSPEVGKKLYNRRIKLS